MNLEDWAQKLQDQEVPFKWRGRDRTGLDCYGLVYLAYKELYRITLPDYVETFDPQKPLRTKQLLQAFQIKDGWKEQDVPRQGDVVLLRVRGHPIHIGLMLRPGLLVHIQQNSQVTIERYPSLAMYYEGHYRCAFLR